MKKILLVLILMLGAVVACSDAKSENPYTLEEAKENGDVIVEHTSTEFDQITQGALEVENIDQITTLLEKVESGEAFSVDISMFNPDGSSYKNTLSTDGETITFENNYGGYKQSPKGTYTCEYIQKRGPMVYLSQCTSEDGKEYTTLLGFVGKKEAFEAVE